MIKLYQFDSCPYCQKVVRSMEQLKLKAGKDFELVEASRNTKGRDEVVKLGGKSQVPFLVDGAKKLYESDDIIAYLKQKFS